MISSNVINKRSSWRIAPFIYLFIGVSLYLILVQWICAMAFSTFLGEVDQRFQMSYISRIGEQLKDSLNPVLKRGEIERALTEEERKNPRLRYYLLDDSFRVIASSQNPPAVEERLLLDEAPILRVLRRGQDALPAEAQDPARGTTRKPFAVTRVTLEGGDGYLYGVISVPEWDAGSFGGRAFRSLRENTTHLALAAFSSLLIGVSVHLLTMRKASGQSILSVSSPNTPAIDEVTALAHAVNSITSSLVEKASKIENRDEQRRSFVTGISQDLRSPLSTIKLHINSLLKAPDTLDPNSREEYYKIIEKNVDRVMRMIDQVFNLAKFESLEESVKMRKFSAFECLHEVVTKFQAPANERGVELEGCFDGNDISCHGDLDLVYKALCNLVENALKYTPAGGRVTLGVEQRGQRAIFFVQDTGEGIAPEDVPKLFEKFYRADGVKGVEDGSSGVGLFMVKRIADVHGGKASVQSVVMEGSRFQFDISLA